jgi:hypothetical protein
MTYFGGSRFLVGCATARPRRGKSQTTKFVWIAGPGSSHSPIGSAKSWFKIVIAVSHRAVLKAPYVMGWRGYLADYLPRKVYEK